MVAMVTVMAQYWQKFEVLDMKDVVCILKSIISVIQMQFLIQNVKYYLEKNKHVNLDRLQNERQATEDIQILLQLPVGYDISPLKRVKFKILTLLSGEIL